MESIVDKIAEFIIANVNVKQLVDGAFSKGWNKFVIDSDETKFKADVRENVSQMLRFTEKYTTLIDYIRRFINNVSMDQCVDASTPRRAQVTRGGIAAAWAGGKDGREVVDRLLPDVADVLSPDGGTMLMILLEQNKPREVMAVLERAGLRCDVVRSASADEERLHVLRAVKGGDR